MPKAATVASALAFAREATAARQVARCSVCTLPADVLAALNALHEAGHDHAIKARWLASIGHPTGRNPISRHFLDHVQKAQR